MKKYNKVIIIGALTLIAILIFSLFVISFAAGSRTNYIFTSIRPAYGNDNVINKDGTEIEYEIIGASETKKINIRGEESVSFDVQSNSTYEIRIKVLTVPNGCSLEYNTAWYKVTTDNEGLFKNIIGSDANNYIILEISGARMYIKINLPKGEMMKQISNKKGHDK